MRDASSSRVRRDRRPCVPARFSLFLDVCQCIDASLHHLPVSGKGAWHPRACSPYRTDDPLAAVSAIVVVLHTNLLLGPFFIFAGVAGWLWRQWAILLPAPTATVQQHTNKSSLRYAPFALLCSAHATPPAQRVRLCPSDKWPARCFCLQHTPVRAAFALVGQMAGDGGWACVCVSVLGLSVLILYLSFSSFIPFLFPRSLLSSFIHSLVHSLIHRCPSLLLPFLPSPILFFCSVYPGCAAC